MTTAKFSGDSRYSAVLAVSRSGFKISATLTVKFSGGYGAWELDGNSNWYANVAGNTSSGKWSYDFRNSTSKRVWSGSRTVSTPGDYTSGGWAEMEGKGRATPGNMRVTVPPNKPAAPTTPVVSRISDTSTRVTWTRKGTSTAPYTSQQVQRREFTGSWSGWSAVATISTNYSTNGTHAVNNGTASNKFYQYRVKASNSSGEAYSGASGYVLTTPATPTAFTAQKKSSGSITLSVTLGVEQTYNTTTLEYSLNGGSTWVSLTTLAGGVTTYSWTPPTGSAVLFRARSVNNVPNRPGHGLASGWRNSNSVALTAPPTAPTALDPNGTVWDGDLEHLFKWKHNPVDSSEQSAYEIHYRPVGGTWATISKRAGEGPSHTFAADTFSNGDSYEWEVRTWGAHPDPSPWSATATFITSTPPSVTITSPDPQVDESTITATWEFFDPEGTAQSMWEARLLDESGSALESRSGSGATGQVLFAYTLRDATEYQVQVRGRDGDSLWSEWDQVTFETSFPTPNVPTIEVYWSTETGTTRMDVTNPNGVPEVEYNDLYRSLDDGDTWTLVGTAPLNGSAFDQTVPLGRDVLYRAEAWTALPSSSQSAEVVFNSEWTQYVCDTINLATNPSFESASATTVNTPDGVLSVPVGVRNDGAALVWQSDVQVFVGEFSLAYEWTEPIAGPYPNTLYPNEEYPGKE